MFRDREAAARELVPLLHSYAHKKDVIILALVRGGVPLGVIIAQALHVPLDICLAKKIGAPYNPEFAIGAATTNTYFVNPAYTQPDERAYIKSEVARVQELLKHRAVVYRQGRAPLKLVNKTVILVDDGIVTGQTMRAAIAFARDQSPKKIIVAVPVIASDTAPVLHELADSVVTVLIAENLGSVGEFYDNFEQLTDERVISLLRDYWHVWDGVR